MPDRDLSGVAGQQVQSECANARDQDRVDDIDLIRARDDWDDDEHEREKSEDAVARKWHAVHREVRDIARAEYACLWSNHGPYTRSMRTRPNRPYGLIMRMATSTKNGKTFFSQPPTHGSR